MDNSNQKDWQPLESNPVLINKFITDLGFDTNKYLFHELLSIEEWGQAMIPWPTMAVMFLYPNNEAHTKVKLAEMAKIKEEAPKSSSDIFFMKQYAKNACGTIAAIHAIVNLGREERDLIKTGSFLDGFFQEVKVATSEESGKIFSENKELQSMHTEVVQQGVTRVENEKWDNHFVCFVQKDGNLYELDGTLDFPINHGPCDRMELLFKATQVVKEYMERDPAEIKFTVLALAPPEWD